MPDDVKQAAIRLLARPEGVIVLTGPDTIMFTRNEVGFCPVCSRAIARVIGLYTR